MITLSTIFFPCPPVTHTRALASHSHFSKSLLIDAYSGLATTISCNCSTLSPPPPPPNSKNKKR